MRNSFVSKLMELAAQDPKITLITGDLGFGVLDEFANRFPKQFINAGVAEQNMTGMACGLAMTGRRVFTYSIGNFCTLRCLEQVRNDICYHDADVTVVSVGGGFSYGGLGVSHFATEDLAILRSLPNMIVVAPTDPWEASELVAQIAKRPGPSYLRLDKGTSGFAPRAGEQVQLGKARRLVEGKDVTLIATGAILREALTAAKQLGEKNISCRVVAVHTIKPLDTAECIAAARETGGIVTVEEHNIVGGLGSAVAETCLEAGAVPRFFRRIGLNDLYPTVVGDQDYLRGRYGMDAAAIVSAVTKALSGA